MIAMGRYFSKYAYASIAHNGRKIYLFILHIFVHEYSI